MDICEGELTLDGISISPDTPLTLIKKGLIGVSRMQIGDFTSFDWMEPLILDGVSFRTSVNYWKDRPAMVILVPTTDEPQMPPSREVQARRRAICDTWLAVHLGKPQERTETMTVYRYSWGWIQVLSSFGGKTPFNGGRIEIHYKGFGA